MHILAVINYNIRCALWCTSASQDKHTCGGGYQLVLDTHCSTEEIMNPVMNDRVLQNCRYIWTFTEEDSFEYALI